MAKAAINILPENGALENTLPENTLPSTLDAPIEKPVETNTEVEVKVEVEAVPAKVNYTFQEILDAWEKDSTKQFKLPEWLTQRVLILRSGRIMVRANQRFEFLHDVTGIILRKDWQEAK